MPSIKKLSNISPLVSELVLLAIVAIGCILAAVLSSSPIGQYNKQLTQHGYTLVAPLNNKNVFLVNNKGKVVHTWHTNNLAGAVTELLPNGELLRTYQTAAASTDFAMGGVGGGIETLNWNSQVTWNYQYDTPDYAQHHDAIVMPNGDVMFLAWVKHDRAQALAAGVNPTNLDPKTGDTWSARVVQIDPNKDNKIVWEWDAWGHLVQNYDKNAPNFGNPADHPGRINANYYAYSEKPDWMHTNSIAYNPKLNQIMISSREFNEVWVIDHSTTTAQAATSHGGTSDHGGNLIYRYGNPAAYGHGDKDDRTLYLQHDAHWITNPKLHGYGDVLIFNDGDTITGTRSYSSVLELKFPRVGHNYARTSSGAFAQPEVVWSYAPTGKQMFFSTIMGSAQRLPNGDTLVTDAVHGRAIEVNSNDQTVWEYTDPTYNVNEYDPSGPKTNDVFRFYKYAPDYSGLAGHKLREENGKHEHHPAKESVSALTTDDSRPTS